MKNADVLTISQLAAYADVTVRAVRHYHAKGLLPEPRRDHSAYRRYDANAVVQLIRIRTLAEAGVPLSRVRELMDADETAFAEAVGEIDRRLRTEIGELKRHRTRIARLAAGDSLALPTDAVDYLDLMRTLGISERMVEGERDAWILVAAQLPEQMEMFIASKRSQFEDPSLVEFYRLLDDMIDWKPGDPRLADVADRLVEQFEAVDETEWEAFTEHPLSTDLADLLDSTFIARVPVATELLGLVEDRGWTGWTNIRRTT